MGFCFFLGECTTQMKSYLACLKTHRGVNGQECRQLARGYLGCRMERYVYIDTLGLFFFFFFFFFLFWAPVDDDDTWRADGHASHLCVVYFAFPFF